jgi:predicted methyltransferase
MKRMVMALALLGGALAAALGSADVDVDALRASLSASSRADADKARDAGRNPAGVVAFLGIGEGAKVMDVIAAGGYYTEVLSVAVGPKGLVYAQNPDIVLKFRDGANEKAITARLAGGRLANVTRVNGDIPHSGIEPGSLDAAVTALNFHDVYNQSSEAALGLLAAIKVVLKPGGTLGIIDHVGMRGQDNAQLHRIEEPNVIDAAVAAGFEVEARGNLLRNDTDDHSKMVFDETVRGKTDRFVIRLRKPE